MLVRSPRFLFPYLLVLWVPSAWTLDKDPIVSYTSLDSPFRMQKVNLLWEKARKNLSEGKLQLLYSELKLQDKEEAALKLLKADQGDKDGSVEAQVSLKETLKLWTGKTNHLSFK